MQIARGKVFLQWIVYIVEQVLSAITKNTAYSVVVRWSAQQHVRRPITLCVDSSAVMTSTQLPMNGNVGASAASTPTRNTNNNNINKNHSNHHTSALGSQQQIALNPTNQPMHINQLRYQQEYQTTALQQQEYERKMPSANGSDASYTIAGHHSTPNGFNGGVEVGGAPLTNGDHATTTHQPPRPNGVHHAAKESIREGLQMNQKITMNGAGNEKNLSLHLNNPFASAVNASTESLHRNGGLTMSAHQSAIVVDPHHQHPAGGANRISGFKSSTESVYDRPVRRPHSIAVAAPLNQRQNELAKEQIYSYGQSYLGQHQPYVSSPQRTAMPTRNSQEFSLYVPPSPLANQPPISGAVPPIVQQRRSQSVPRPMQSPLAQPILAKANGVPAVAVTSGSTLIQRPRSLDRCNGINPPDKSYKPPIPNRRMSQSGLAGVPPTPTSRPAGASQMRQSATFHGQGQLNRLAANFNYPTSDSALPSDNGSRRKSDRPLSYAYGTPPDQVFLENQLRIYSEQLRNITESVRKYSEQAKLLSEMKRQQAHKQQAAAASTGAFPNSVPIERCESLSKGLYLAGGVASDSNSSLSSVKNGSDDAQTPSHQLRLFLDNIRHTIKEPSQDDLIPEAAEAATPVKTPSDQLRQFLDAIRSNQVPEESDIKGACDRFHKFKEKVEQSRPKSLQTNHSAESQLNKSVSTSSIYGISTSESFSQISDNLRIMNEDLEALAQKSFLTNGSHHINPQNNNTSASVSRADRQILQFNRLLDDFQRMTGHQHAPETVDYFRKCSEALRNTKPAPSEQLSVSTSFGNGFGGEAMSESSSCSTTPGSIREAVQNLLMQPRNGVQIMDDRMRLFIEIVDSQDKFSQVIGPFGVHNYWIWGLSMFKALVRKVMLLVYLY